MTGETGPGNRFCLMPRSFSKSPPPGSMPPSTPQINMTTRGLPKRPALSPTLSAPRHNRPEKTRNRDPMTLLELIELLKKRLALVVALPVAFGLIAAVYCFLFMPNEYTATTSMYVLSTRADDTANVASSDLSASQMLANDVAKLFTSDRITRETLEATGLDSLSDYSVGVESSTTTRVITLRVTGPDPRNAAAIANTMADRVSDIAREVMGIEAVNVLDSAQVPTSPSGPRRLMYVAVACMAGLFAAVAIVVLADTLDTRVRSADEISDLIGVPVIGRFPAMRKGR